MNGVLISLVLLLAVTLVGARFIGFHPYVVLSGSMEPAYKTGSIIYVKDASEELQKGDVITYQLNDNTVATHRIVEVIEESGEIAYRTKGDANDIVDGTPVKAEQVLGTPIFTIPYLGYLVTYLQTTSGRYATIAVGAGLVLMVFLPDMIFGKDNKEEEMQ